MKFEEKMNELFSQEEDPSFDQIQSLILEAGEYEFNTAVKIYEEIKSKMGNDFDPGICAIKALITLRCAQEVKQAKQAMEDLK